MGPYQRTPRKGARAIKYLSFRVPVEDFLDTWVLTQSRRFLGYLGINLKQKNSGRPGDSSHLTTKLKDPWSHLPNKVTSDRRFAYGIHICFESMGTKIPTCFFFLEKNRQHNTRSSNQTEGRWSFTKVGHVIHITNGGMGTRKQGCKLQNPSETYIF